LSLEINFTKLGKEKIYLFGVQESLKILCKLVFLSQRWQVLQKLFSFIQIFLRFFFLEKMFRFGQIQVKWSMSSQLFWNFSFLFWISEWKKLRIFFCKKITSLSLHSNSFKEYNYNVVNSFNLYEIIFVLRIRVRFSHITFQARLFLGIIRLVLCLESIY